MTWITFIDNIEGIKCPNKKKYNLHTTKLYTPIIHKAHILKIINYNTLLLIANIGTFFSTRRKFYIKIKNLDENNATNEHIIFNTISVLLIGQRVSVKDLIVSREGMFQADIYLGRQSIYDILMNLGIISKKPNISFDM
tara:strand:+ start:401 stop:817 length:417 start_codon:yes stop_codon:yes gene_type:complete